MARDARRRGIILPVLVLWLVALVGFLALAIDLGMMAIAKTQTQQAADLAALVAARTVNGNAAINYNRAAATTNTQNVLTYNTILGQSIVSSQLQLTYGSYDYNPASQTFSANFPETSGQPTAAVSATITSNSLQRGFSSIFGTQLLPAVSATAQSAHRPRDIALVEDLSGSMRLGTCLGYDFYTPSRISNNPDILVPSFGHYSSGGAGLVGSSTNTTSSFANYTISPSNTTVTNPSYTLTNVNSFYQNSAYATPLIRAFDSSTSSDGGGTWTASTSGSPQLPPDSYASGPKGESPLFVKGSSTAYATDVYDVVRGPGGNNNYLRDPAWELDGYANYYNGQTSAASGESNYTRLPFRGYTQGPGYYGKTFFIWPPDPRGPWTPNTNYSTQINQFLGDFGYTGPEIAASASLQNIYNNWPWPDDGGVSLNTHLTTNVNLPKSVGSGKLSAGTDQYQKIMRLYWRNYPFDRTVDSTGQTACDWRLRFFGRTDNTLLFNSSSGLLNLPDPSTYTIKYNEVLRWIKQVPKPFPTQLRAGRVKYYGSIPDQITGSWPDYGSTDQRFWVEFIDYVLGFRQTSAGVYQDVSAMVGYGSDFGWAQTAINSPPSVTQYMNYTDNPLRPKLRYWFGPLMLVDFLQNYNMVVNTPGYFVMQAGDSYEAPIYNAKQAFLAAVDTMQANHPNDSVTVVPYSSPRTGVGSQSNPVPGRFNSVSSPLSANYNYAKASLVFPFSTINPDGSANNTEITPYDPDPSTGTIPSANFADTPRAEGGTCFSMGLMLAYNQFASTAPADGTLRNFVTSSPITFPAGMAGGLGRKGAQKVIIFETDGLPNTAAYASLNNNGSYKYYSVRYNMNNPWGSEYPSSYGSYDNDPAVLNQVYSLVQQLATDHGTSRNPFRLYALGFGPVFQGPNSTSAMSTLQTMQYYAGTQSSPSTALPSNQVITGTGAQMSASLIAAFTSILQNGKQIALIK